MYPPNFLNIAIYDIVYRLIEIFIAPLEIYVRKDRSHGVGLINLWPGSRGMLIELQILHQTIILQGCRIIWCTALFSLIYIYNIGYEGYFWCNYDILY